MRENFEQAIREAVSIEKKLERYEKIDEITAQAVSSFEEKEYENEKEKAAILKQVAALCHQIEADEVRRLIIEDPPGWKKDRRDPSIGFPSRFAPTSAWKRTIYAR